MGAQLGHMFQKLVTSAGAKLRMKTDIERATSSGTYRILTTLVKKKNS